MSDPTTPDEFTDVNEAVGEDWEAETTPYERVREVISHTYAAVSGRVCGRGRTHLAQDRTEASRALAEEGFVATEPGEHGGTYYRRSPESLVVEQAADIPKNVTVDELVDRIAEMRETLDDFRSEYGVDSPEELTIEQTNRTLSGTAPGGPEISTEDLREWQMTRRNLAFANAALSIATAERFVDEGAASDDGSVPIR